MDTPERLSKFRKDTKIPFNWDVGPSKKGQGLSFSKSGTSKADEVRIKEPVQGNQYPNSRIPNVRLKKDGTWRDINGNVVTLESEAAHIPLEGFKFPHWM